MTRFLCVIALVPTLFTLGCSTGRVQTSASEDMTSRHPAQERAPENLQVDAIKILQGTTKDGTINPGEIHKVEMQLRAIVAKFPSVSQVHSSNKMEDELIQASLSAGAGELQARLLASLYPEMQTGSEDDSRFDLTKGTGIPELDQLNRTLPLAYAKAIVRRARVGDQPRTLTTLNFYFKQNADIETIAELYKKFFPAHSIGTFSGIGVGGEGDIIRRRVEGNLVDYDFIKSCPSYNCNEKLRWYFQVDTSAHDFRVTEIFPEGFGGLIEPFGGDRWSVRAFKDYSDLLEKLRSPTWWIRLHAVNMIGKLYQNKSEWVGEDYEYMDPVTKERTDTREFFRQMRKDIVQTHNVEMNSILSQMSRQDPDSVVKEAARAAYDASSAN